MFFLSGLQRVEPGKILDQGSDHQLVELLCATFKLREIQLQSSDAARSKMRQLNHLKDFRQTQQITGLADYFLYIWITDLCS